MLIYCFGGYSQNIKKREKTVGLNFGFALNSPNNYSKNNFIKSANTITLPIGIEFCYYFKEKLGFYSSLNVNWHKDKMKARFITDSITIPQSYTASYKFSNIYLINIGLKYQIIKKNKLTAQIGLGPQLFLQSKTGTLTTSTDSLFIKDRSMNSYLFVTNSSVFAKSKINFGYKINAEIAKQLTVKQKLSFILSYQNSFSTLRQTTINSTKNGIFYDSVLSNFTGKSFFATLTYAFKI